MPPTRRNRRSRKLQIPANNSTATVLDLNEHCLMDVFDYLSPLDMCSVFDTCKRFREVAINAIDKFYQINELIVSDEQRSTYKLLCKFGPALTKLRIEFWRSHNEQRRAVYSTIRKSKPKLDSLTLTDTNFEAALELRPLLGNVRKIRLEYLNLDLSCDIHFRSDIRSEDTIKALFKACTNVEEISFGARASAMGTRYQGIFLQQRFKKLRSLEIGEVRVFDVNNLKLFLKFNPNVRRLSLNCCVCLDKLGATTLLQNAPNIEAVTLKFGENDYSLHENTVLPTNVADMLCQLDNMKYLTLDTCRTCITEFIASMSERNALSYLSLDNVILKINEGLEQALSSMTNLKILRLHINTYAGLAPADYVTLCKPLVNLDELHLLDDMITLQQIGDIIENSDNLKKLYFLTQWPKRGGIQLLDEHIYGTFVHLQLRKNTPFPLTFFFESLICFPLVMKLIPADKLSPNVIKISKFQLSNF